MLFAAFALAAFAGVAEAQLPSPVFRFYNTQTGTHFYTINQAERDLVLVRYPQFAYEGPAYFAYPQPRADNLPVYRFYNTSTGTHFYTQSEAEKEFVLASFPVFAFEGPAYYAPAAAGAGRTPLFRFYNTHTGAHFFTTNGAERDMVLQKWPFFAFEGTAYQVYPTGAGAGGNSLPIAKLTVSPSTVVAVPAIVSLVVDASDADGIVSRVEYFLGADKIGETVLAPHQMNYALLAAGNYAFRAVAFDNQGAPGSSATINLAAGTMQTNIAPKVSLTATPASMSTGGPVTLTAVASDDDGTIASVKFYEGNTVIATVASAPYTTTYTTTAAKIYRFRAVATDNLGLSTTSPEFGVNVGALINIAPKVALSVSPGSLAAPGLVTLNATASDDDGTIARVSFYANGTKILDVAAPPYTTSYNATSNAIYKFTAIATDDKGLSTSTADVNVSVGQTTNLAPKVALAVSQTQVAFPGTVTMTATASDDDGTIARVRFYQNGALRSDVTTAPYTFSYTTTVPGIFKFKAIAIDNKNASTSTAEIDVTSGNAQQLNKKPSVSLSLSTTLVMAPATVNLSVSASDTDGTIQKVQFYRNGAKIGEKLASPFTLTDTIASNGQVAYHADAIDNVGNVGTTLPQVVSAQTPPPVVTNDADIWRLMNQATFGASQAEAASVKSLGITGWINAQLAKPMSGYPATRYNRVQLNETADCTTRDPLGQNYPSNSPQAMCVRDHLSLAMMQRDLYTNGVYGGDQLRQRVAWALSQILVISAVEQDLSRAHVMARYQQIMFEEAFGNFETILKRITVSPAMGNWLDSVNNDRPDATKGRVPNENYAREIMQLFSVGLVELKADGTPLLDALGQEIPTYDQDDIKEFARVFTGYTYANADGSAITKKNGVYYGTDMGVYPGTATTGHDTDLKTLLNNATLAAGQTPQKDLDDAVHNVFIHANTGPFIAKQMIQRLVTGNPSAAYVQRITQVFNNNGAGVRGDLKAVVRAILLDGEARGPAKSDPAFGTLREPVLMISGLLRALNGLTDGSALGDRASNLNQRPYYAPTVFNYFQPDATVPGTSILAPEFAIYNSNSAVARTNLVYGLVYSGIAPDGNLQNATGTRLNIVQFEPLATDAALLTDKVSEMLLGGPLSAAARTAVMTAVNAIAPSAPPTAQQRTDRARMAVYLVASSNHFQIQR
ncbi:MAG: DUF1800 family protein [Betaproteobacteria bacterium]